MNRKIRKWLFLGSAAALAAVLGEAYARLPPTGEYRGPYGYVVNAISVPERHITDAVTAVTFDIRGFDTLGEEFILFGSVMAVVLLLRRLKENDKGKDKEDHARGRKPPLPSDAQRVVASFLAAPIVLFGIYIVTHGQITPGGGFQGGIILATAPLIVYLGSSFERFHRMVPRRLVEIGEALGAGAYALIGLAAAATGAAFLTNVLPLGTTATVFAGGIVPLISLGVGLEVSGGVLLIQLAYLEELLEEQEQ